MQAHTNTPAPLGVIPLDPLLRLKDVTYYTKLSKTTIYRLMGEGRFPKQIKLSIKASAWKQSEVQAFMNGEYAAKEVQP